MEAQKKYIYSILVPIPALGDNCIFDYFYNNPVELFKGQIVKVPFGVKNIIWGIISEKKVEETDRPLKNIIEVSNINPFSENFMAFIKWVSEWTMASQGSILKLVFSVPNQFENKNIEFGWIAASEIGNRLIKEVFPNLRITKNRLKILNSINNLQPISSEDLISRSGASKTSILALEKEKVIFRKKIVQRGHENSFKLPNYKANMIDLNPNQKKASEHLINLIAQKKFNTVLLDGVTGSGKTEGYFQAILETLKLNKQVLVLLPEIYLSIEWSKRFKDNFGLSPLLWHSSLSNKDRMKTWNEVNQGKINAIVGARSALFLPYKNLGLIIIDEEHDHSYKQEDGVLYNARDMALLRAKIEKIPIILSTATPSLETWTNVKNNKFSNIKLPERVGLAKMPEVNIIDMRKVEIEHNNWISSILGNRISENLKNKELSLLFLNRRGYAPLKLCGTCGYRLGCKNCQSWLVEHRKKGLLVCHQCGLSKNFDNSCNNCGNKDCLISCGPGVERLDEEVKSKFPSIKSAILSSDTIKSPKIMKGFFDNIENGKIDLIIGTQIISKGHNFKNLTLIGIIDADMSLSGGDLRASEKAFQVLHQVSGRAGRESKKGTVIIQTHDPENEVIDALKKNNRDYFLKIESENRKIANLPPFGKLVSLILSSKDEGKLIEFANALKFHAPRYEKITVLGPAPAPISLLRGKHRYRFLIKSSKNINIQKVVKNWINQLKKPASIRLIIDIEPYSFL